MREMAVNRISFFLEFLMLYEVYSQNAKKKFIWLLDTEAPAFKAIPSTVKYKNELVSVKDMVVLKLPRFFPHYTVSEKKWQIQN